MNYMDYLNRQGRTFDAERKSFQAAAEEYDSRGPEDGEEPIEEREEVECTGDCYDCQRRSYCDDDVLEDF